MKLRRKLQFFLPPYMPSTKATLLDKGLTALIAVLAGIGAYVLAPRFAAYLNIETFKSQAETEILRTEREYFVKKQFELRTTIDSCVKQIYMSYERGVSELLGKRDSSSITQRRAYILSALTPLGTTLKLYEPYLDSSYRAQAWLLHEAFRGIVYKPARDWPTYEFLLMQQTSLLSFESIERYAQPLTGDRDLKHASAVKLPTVEEFREDFANPAKRPTTYLDSINVIYRKALAPFMEGK